MNNFQFIYCSLRTAYVNPLAYAQFSVPTRVCFHKLGASSKINYLLQDLFGHAKIAITGDTYSHVPISVQRTTANTLDKLIPASNQRHHLTPFPDSIHKTLR